MGRKLLLLLDKTKKIIKSIDSTTGTKLVKRFFKYIVKVNNYLNINEKKPNPVTKGNWDSNFGFRQSGNIVFFIFYKLRYWNNLVQSALKMRQSLRHLFCKFFNTGPYIMIYCKFRKFVKIDFDTNALTLKHQLWKTSVIFYKVLWTENEVKYIAFALQLQK